MIIKRYYYCTIELISHASKVMLKIVQAKFQQYVNCELPDVQPGFRKGRGIRDQIANICWNIKKAREFQKNSTSALLYAGQEATVINGHGKKKFLIKKKKRNGHGTTDGFQIGKGVYQGCILSPCLFSLFNLSC